MKETLQDIKERRSCRKFQTRQISEADLNAILEAGTWAASGKGHQSARMVVIQDKETIAQLTAMNAKIMGVTSDPFYGAPTIILVLADSTWPTYREDGALVMGNLMLAAHAVGAASCWIHRAREEFESPEGKALLKKWGIDEKYAGIGHCSLGYADPSWEPKAQARKSDYIIRI